MPYLGSPPQSGFITTAKQRVTSSTNNYVDLDNAISSLADVIVWVNFVKQDSTNLSLTSSTRITLGGTLVSSDIVEIAYLGKAVNTQTPGTATVTNDMLAGSITESKLAGSIGLNKLSATGTKSSSTFLRGDNTFAAAGLTGWSTGGTQNSLIPSHTSQGIYLGVSSATASNLLSDYEFGTFTPDADPTNNSFSAKGTMSGFYTKVGNIVHYQIEISITTNGSASGNVEVYNLPFTTASSGLVHTVNHGRETQVNGSTFVTIQSVNTTTLVMLGPPFGNGAGYSLNGTYRV
tara:strand:+ start:925 stop:1797 length:873 start_codon:yes stop_codon:yes gene_type:complete